MAKASFKASVVQLATPGSVYYSKQNPNFGCKAAGLFWGRILHEVGKGDGIEQESAQAEEIPILALWGLRFLRPLMHDGTSSTNGEAILRHAGDVSAVIAKYRELPQREKMFLLAFLKSL